MTDSVSHGEFCWYGLMSSAPAGAAEFYSGLLGWSTASLDSGGRQYDVWQQGGAPFGGLMDMPPQAVGAESALPHWLPFVSTHDVAATSQLAQTLGGRVLVERTQVPGRGQYVVLADPQGAVFAAFGRDAQAQATPRSAGQQFAWHELVTTDYAAALVFYGALFGWQPLAAHDMGDMGVYQVYGLDHRQLGGMFNKGLDISMPPAWMLYITVPDLDNSLATVSHLGGQIYNGPMEVPGGGRVAQCGDPQGAAFALHQPAVVPAASPA